MLINQRFWQGKRVLVTGHTGFKGGWLSLWLKNLGADVTGYSLPASSQPNFFNAVNLSKHMRHIEGDIRDQASLQQVFNNQKIEIVFHLAAQSLVRPSYSNPVETYDINVMGSLKLLECVRKCESVRAVVMVTTDKCYRNNEWTWAYREIDPMGGYDPYSSSKGAMELMVDSYRNSFFPPQQFAVHGKAVATARAGNVIGGGDWSEDRLIPDIVRALSENSPAIIRNAHAIRPWQHVLQPLHGYLLLAQKLFTEGASVADAWNFGPREDDCQPVGALATQIVSLWGDEAQWLDQSDPDALHEASFLKLDSSKAKARLGWKPNLDLAQALHMTIEWYRAYYQDADMYALTLSQIDRSNEI